MCDRSAVTASRMAATGGTAAARRAGSSAARTVTTSPTTRLTATVRGCTTTEVDGREPPKELMIACRTRATPIPAPRPRTEASSPTTTASTTTLRVTCPRLAPSARSSASSRCRCATRIVNVLKIRKAPTNSAMPANTSRKVRKNPKNPLISSACSCALSTPVSAWASAGSTAATRSRRVSASMPSRPATRMEKSRPSGANRRSASACANALMLAPPTLSLVPNPNTPDRVKSRLPCASRIGTESPTW